MTSRILNRIHLKAIIPRGLEKILEGPTATDGVNAKVRIKFRSGLYKTRVLATNWLMQAWKPLLVAND